MTDPAPAGRGASERVGGNGALQWRRTRVKRNGISRIVAVVGVLVCVAAVAADVRAADQSARRKPNVVLIVADDLGYADLGCQGQSKDVKTPNIDALAASGVRFTNGYVSCPVCSPTRAGLLTGRYQQRFGFEWNPKAQQEEAIFGIPADEVLLPQCLKSAGYATGAIGKWHLGSKAGMEPYKRGFDEFFGFLGGAHRYIKNDPASPNDANTIRRNEQPVGEKAYLTDAFTREAVAFIDRHKDGPFFLYLPYNATHTPLQAPPKYLARFPDETDENRRTFLAMLSAMDDGVGQVLARLRELKLDDDTLVIFLSDNGGPTPGNTSLNTPLRGTKGSTFEGGVRIPLMMRWTGRLPAGKVDDRVVVQLDLFPTILAAAGVEPPAGRKLDGKDLLPYLTGASAGAVVHDTLFWRFGPRRAVRSGDWKLQWNGDDVPRLYDLAKDVGEATDVAAANPEVAQRMMASWKAWDAELMAPRWPGRLEGDGGTPADESRRAARPGRKR
jgi:arylsulfatase A-like enzyme